MNTITKPKRSIPLSQQEVDALKTLRNDFSTEVEFAISIGIDRNVLARVIQVGSGSQVTISKIRKFLKRRTNLV